MDHKAAYVEGYWCAFSCFEALIICTSTYSDSQGITADFNLNLLDRINKELEVFDLEFFEHQPEYKESRRNC
jgi:uncharacterized SAM-dependent methyltransferase